MLVLRRNVHEKLLIGPAIEVTFLECNRNWVRVGIEAPSDVPIHRDEMFRDESEQRDGRPTYKDELQNVLTVLRSKFLGTGDEVLIALRNRLKSVLEA